MLKPMSKKKLLMLIAAVAVVYGIQFLLLPGCLPRYYPVSKEATRIFLYPLVVLCVAGSLLWNVDMKLWLLPDVLYGLLLCIYNGQGCYGIGLRGVALDGMHPIYTPKLAVVTALVITLILMAFQALLRALRFVFVKVKRSYQQ